MMLGTTNIKFHENGFSNHSVFSLMSLKLMNFVQIEKQVSWTLVRMSGKMYKISNHMMNFDYVQIFMK